MNCRSIYSKRIKRISLLLCLLIIFQPAAGSFLGFRAAVFAEEGEVTGIPPAGHFSLSFEGTPWAELDFYTDADYILDLKDFKGSPGALIHEAFDELRDGKKGENTEKLATAMLLESADSADENALQPLMRKYLDEGRSWYDAFSNVTTFMTLSDADNILESTVMKKLDGMGDAMSALGIYLSIWDYLKTERGTYESKKTGASLFSTYFTKLLSDYGTDITFSSGLSVALVGLSVVELSINKLASAGDELQEAVMDNIYTYYNDSYRKDLEGGARSMSKWREVIIGIIDENAEDNAEKIPNLIEEEIDRFCERFWKLPPETQAELETELNMKTLLFGPTGFTLKDYDKGKNRELRQKLTREYKAELYRRLYSVWPSVKREYAKRAAEKLKELIKPELKYLNTDIAISIRPPVRMKGTAQESYPFNGYIARLQLEDEELMEQYKEYVTVTLKGSFTLLHKDMTRYGYLAMGAPQEVAFWNPDQDPDKDEPEFTKTIEWDNDRPLDLKLESEDVGGDFSFSYEEKAAYEDNMYGVSEYASFYMLDDIFGVNINNLGLPSDYGLTLTAEPGKADLYEVSYEYSVGETGGHYKGKGKLSPDGQLKAELEADRFDSFTDQTRHYLLVFELDFKKDPDCPAGTLKIYRRPGKEDVLFAEYTLTLQPRDTK